MKIRYKNGRTHCLTYGEEYTNNSANGFYVNQKIAVNGYKAGDKVSKGDVLTYNKEFFQADPYSKQVNWKIGILARVAICDLAGSLEDASILTKGICERMSFEPVHVKEITITTDTHVHAFADVGTEVASTDALMVFDESAMNFGEDADDEMVQILSNLNKLAPKAEYSGTIAKIDVLYKSPLSSMDSSVSKIIKHVTKIKNQRAQFAEGCDNIKDYPPSTPLYATDKVGIVDLEPETVIFRFYIKQHKGMNPGDKLFFDNCLKSVCSSVYDEITTEGGEQVAAITSGRGVLARIISSPFIQGLANAALRKLEEDVISIYDTGSFKPDVD